MKRTTSRTVNHNMNRPRLGRGGIGGAAALLVAGVLLAVAIVTVFPLAGWADEPGWSDEERLARRDMVCVGKVVSVDKSGPINEREDVWVATVEIAGLKKGPKIAAGSKVQVFYEFSKSGKNDRRPAYAELKKGDEATFYLQDLSVPWQVEFGFQKGPPNAWVLELGSDVKKEAAKAQR
jgi:hypothetical protein